MRACWEQLFRDHQLKPQPLRIECGAELTVRGLLLEDDWLTLMSRDQFLFERRAGRLAEIGSAGPQLRRQIGMTTRSDWYPTRAQSVFVQTFATGLRRTRAAGRCAGWAVSLLHAGIDIDTVAFMRGQVRIGLLMRKDH